MNHWLYLLLNLGSFSVPFVFSFHPKLRFHKEWKFFIPAMIIVAIAFILWDQLFTKSGIWGFNPKYVSGIYIGELPLEEILFFICIPYACVFTYHCFNLFFEFKWPNKLPIRFTSLLIIFLLTIAFLNFQKYYTFFTFIFLSVFLSYFTIIDKKYHIEKLYSTWFFLLVPFLIVNGILTGTGLDEPVVWYNNDHNLGLRILTIPVEDIFYGFLLFASCVLLTDKFKALIKN